MSRWTAVACLAGVLLVGTHAWADAPAKKQEKQEQPDKQSVEGKIKSLRGKTLTIALGGDELPPAGADCTVLKYFQKNLGFLKTQGWLEIAEAKVKKSDKTLVLTVVKKKSEMKVNGKPVNHFKAGLRAKVTWVASGE